MPIVIILQQLTNKDTKTLNFYDYGDNGKFDENVFLSTNDPCPGVYTSRRTSLWGGGAAAGVCDPVYPRGPVGVWGEAKRSLLPNPQILMA